MIEEISETLMKAFASGGIEEGRGEFWSVHVKQWMLGRK